MAEAAGPAPASLRIAVAVSLNAGEAEEWALQLPAGAALADALAASVVLGRLKSVDISEAGCGIWGQRAALFYSPTYGPEYLYDYQGRGRTYTMTWSLAY